MAPSRDRHRPLTPLARRTAWLAFHGHLWVGVVFTVVLAAIGVTGILLNHKRPLGLMPDVAHVPSAPFTEALPLATLAERAVDAARAAGVDAGVDRMDVRPDDGYVKVRLDDPATTEVTVDLATGEALEVAPRNDVFLEKLHSGEIFGDRWILLSDAAAIGLVLLLASGYWLWLFPRWRRS